MIFISGIGNKEEDLDFSQMLICPNCGGYGRLYAFMTYNRFSLFFIPILKWGKKYYMESSCCKTIFLLDKNIGADIENKIGVNVKPENLEIINRGHREYRCKNCSTLVNSDFEYCPKCGEKL